MINFFVAPGNAGTVRPFLLTWANKVGSLFRVIPYDDLTRIRSVGPSAYIFSDLERIGPTQLRSVEALCELIATRLSPTLIVNRPTGLLLRYELLQGLREAGINQFRAFPFDDSGSEIRYPAFLRMTDDHNGPLTGLLMNAEERSLTLAKLTAAGKEPDKLITIEFCDTRGADGLYRKFSAFRLGDRIVPGHLLVSPDWVTKDSGPEPLRDEERDYLIHNPHRDELMRIFELARITYGRIDYGLREGKIQVWEINTNPTLIQNRDKYSADKLPLKQQLVDQLSDAFLELHRRADSVAPRKVRVPLKLFHGCGIRPRALLRRLLHGLSL